ncbi:MAG: hypothetical protein HC875_11575, partial [Anaerolineales bacterium]|nr:hypothetical protein [Anaerolineales bacterium]
PGCPSDLPGRYPRAAAAARSDGLCRRPKAGLEAFAEALGKEERQRRVTLVRPGAVATPLWSKAGLKLPATAISPETLAQRILEAHESGHKGLLNFD